MSKASKDDKVMDEEESDLESHSAEGQAGATKEQSMSESQSRAFRADASHQDPQTALAQQSEQSIFEI